MVDEINGNGDWGQWRRAVLQRFHSIEDAIKGLDSKVDEVRTDDLPELRADIRELQARAAVWGGITGAVFGAALGALAAVMIRK